MLTVLLYAVIFRNLVFTVKFIFCYGLFVAFGMIHFIFITAAALNSSVHRPYKLLNSIVAKPSTDKSFVRIARLRQKIKVINISIHSIQNNLNYLLLQFQPNI